MTVIHPTAIIEDGAEIGDDTHIGPYCVIGADVVIGPRCVLESHVVVQGNTTIGAECRIFPFSSIGQAPQDLKFRGENSRLRIGARTVIREHVTVNPGTEGGGMLTEIGDDCLLMVGAHVAHDCRIGDHVILVNNATLGGHVIVQDHAIIGGLSAVQQFSRIGRHAMVGGASGVENDVIPFGMVTGNRARLGGLNIVGLRRRGFPRDDIHALRHAYKALFASEEGVFNDRLERVARDYADSAPVMEMVTFIRETLDNASSGRGLCQPARDDGGR